jgi:hypothetical protein
MSYNFHQVKTHEQSELFKLRARIILDIETFMSDEERSDDQLFPNFFQVLQRKTSKTTEDVVKSVRALAWGILFLAGRWMQAGCLLAAGCANGGSGRTLCKDAVRFRSQRCSTCGNEQNVAVAARTLGKRQLTETQLQRLFAHCCKWLLARCRCFVSGAVNCSHHDGRGSSGFVSARDFAHRDNIELQDVGIALQCIVQIWHGAAPETQHSMSKWTWRDEPCSCSPVTMNKFLDVRAAISTDVHDKPVAVYNRALDPMHRAFS